MASSVTRDHHNLRRDLILNDNHIVNQAGDDALTVSDAGNVGVNIDSSMNGGMPSYTLQIHNQAAPVLFIGNEGNSNDTSDLAFGYANTILAKIRAYHPTGGDTNLGFFTSTNSSGDNTIEYLTITHDGNVGVGTNTPISALEIEGGLTTVGAVLTLGTKEPTVVANDVLGRINFYAPLDTGTDSDEIGASIAAIAQDTFSDTVNATALHFQTGKSEIATTKMVIDEDGNIGIGVTDPDTLLEIFGTSTQLKLSHNANDYATFTVADTGDLTIATVGDGTTDSDLTLDADGDINLDTAGSDINFLVNGTGLFHFHPTTGLTLKSISDVNDYARIAVAANGAMSFTTVDDTGNNQAFMNFAPQGDIKYAPADGQQMLIQPTTKTASGTSDNTLKLVETLDMDSGAGGSDVHYGIWYAQTQTDLTGWDSVYLMYLDNGSDKFIVDKDAQLILDVNEATVSGSSSNKAIHIDIDNTGANSSGTLTSTGLDLDMDRSGAHPSSTSNQVGIDIDLVGQTTGTQTNTGINIAVSAADTNYALITSGGNVGIGVADPDQALEVNGDIHVESTVYFTAETANTIGNGATGTIDWNTSQKQKVTITGTGITCNFTNPAGPCNLLLKVVQGDGSDVIATWDGDIKWPGNDTVPTLSTGNGDIDIISFYFDGTNYFGEASLDFA